MQRLWTTPSSSHQLLLTGPHPPVRRVIANSWLGDADGLVTTGAVISSSLGVLYSATLGVASSSTTPYPPTQSNLDGQARLPTGVSQQQLQQQQQNSSSPAVDDSDGFQWGLMGVLSVFPLFNWMVGEVM